MSVFKNKGFLDQVANDVNFRSSVFNALLRIALDIFKVQEVVDAFEIGDFGVTYSAERAGAMADMLIMSGHKPTSPMYNNIPATGANQQAFRLPKVEQLFLDTNDDYADYMSRSWIDTKEIFEGEYGISWFISAYMKTFTNTYKIHKQETTLECVNALLNDTDMPLKDTQKLTLTSWTTAANGRMTPTSSELMDLVGQIKDVVEDMDASITTSAYNQFGFGSHVDTGKLRVLYRAGLKSALETVVPQIWLASNFGKDPKPIPFELIPVKHFGGLIPTVELTDNATGDGVETEFTLSGTYNDSAEVSVGGVVVTSGYTIDGTTITFDTAPSNGDAIVVKYNARVYPVYATPTTIPDVNTGIGEQIGYALTANQTTAAYTDKDVTLYDPNSKVIAVIADKEAVIHVIKNPFTVRSAPGNVAGLYDTMHATAPRNIVRGNRTATLIACIAP